MRETFQREPKKLEFEFSRNAQSWQYWHFCTTLNGNKLEKIWSWINLMQIIFICHGALE